MRAKKQPNMVISPDRARLLLDLTDEQAGQIIKALVTYANTQALPQGFSEVLLFCFNALLDDIEQVWKKDAHISEQNRRSAKKRWATADGCERMRTDADGCERMRADANECERMRADANGCERMRADANGCERMRADANECERMRADANGCERMRADANGCERMRTHTEDEQEPLRPQPAGADPMQYMMTGEDGEAIVVYKHG